MTRARAFAPFGPFALAALLAAAAPARAQAEPDAPKGARALAEAREHARQGAALYRESDFSAALVEFKRAYALVPNYRVLYNVAQAHAALQDYASALLTFERYLSEGGPKVPRERRASIEAEIAKLSARVAAVRVRVNVDGAEVFVDGVPVGYSPLAEPLRLNAGVRALSASKPPLAPASRTVELAGRDQATVSLEIAPLASPPPPSDEPTAPTASTASTSPPARRARDAPPPGPGTPWVGIALTGAFAAGALTTGLLALDARHDFDHELGRFPSSENDVDRARTRMHVLGISTDVLAVAALATAAVSAYPFVFRARRPDAAAWGLRVGPAGATFEGRF